MSIISNITEISIKFCVYIAYFSLLTSTLVPLGSFQMLKREWGTESSGKLPHLFIPDKTAALVPEFAVEDLPSAELQP